MGVLILGRAAEYEQGLRPLDILRDLDGVARLLNLVFADDMARDGTDLQRDLALLWLGSPLIWTLRRLSAEVRDAFDGFVWIEDRQIVGNVTLTRDDPNRHVWTVSNVAVHPDYRRHGIARALMQACMQCVRERGGGPLFLEVKASNQAAYRLYQSLGFRFVEGTWTARHSGQPGLSLPTAGQVRRVRRNEWPKLFELARAAHSADAQNLTPIQPAAYRQSSLQVLAQTLQDALLREQRFWLTTDTGERFLVAAYVHRRPGGSSCNIMIHPDAPCDVQRAIIDGLLMACLPSSSAITVRLPSTAANAISILEHYGFIEVRNLHRLMIEV